MRATRRLISLFALATVVALPASLPALAQSGTASDVTHRQSVRTEMGPDGEVKASRVFTQLTVVGDGQVDISLPNQSTDGLRNLDGFGRPRVDGDQVVHTVEASRDGAAERTVATNTAALPVELEVSYTLDGETIAPKDLVGKSGEVTATFTARNTTAQPTEVRYFDGRQTAITETIDVSVPIVGSISLDLDGRFVDIEAPLASVAGNGRGDTRISWSMVLFSPVGSEEQTVSYTAHVTDAIVPEVVGQFLPVDSRSFGSLKSVQETFGGVADGLTSLTTGGLIVDGNVKLLAAGAAQLLDGLSQLEEGASALAAGLNDTAVPGARQLADGTGQARAGSRQLADGLLELQDGAGQLSDGLGSARSGAGELSTGLQALAAGAGQLRAGMGSAFAGGQALVDGLNTLAAGATALEAGATQVATGAVTLDQKTGELAAGTVQIKDGAAGLLGGLETLKAALNAPTGTAKLIAGVDQLSVAVAGMQRGIGSSATPDTLLNGLARLDAGLSNPACDLNNPQNPANPCGVLQVLGALRAGLGSATAPETVLNGLAQVTGGINNPGCLPANPTDPANPCGLKQGAQAIAGGASQMLTQAEEAKAGLEAILPALDAALVLPPADKAQVIGTVQSVIAGIGSVGAEDTLLWGLARTQGGATGMITGIDDRLLPGLTKITAGVQSVNAGLAALESAVGSPTTANTLRNGVARITGGLNNPACNLNDPQNAANPCGLLQALGLVGGGLDNPAAEAVGTSTYNPQCLAPGDTGYRAGMAPCGLKQGLKLSLATINAGLGSATDDPAKSPTLLGGANALAQGSQALSAGATQLRAEGTGPLAAGAGQVAGGAGQLADGAGAASAGGGQLVDGLGQLNAGTGDLAAGAGKAADGGKALGSGLVQLDDGARKLYAGAGTAANGGNDLANGLVQIDDGANQLAGGLGDAGDGAGQIAEGLGSAKEGGEKIADGTQALTDRGMAQIIDGASEATKTPALAVAQAKAADARGKAGDGLPYGTADGSVASAVYQFELAGLGGPDEGASTPVKAAATLAAFGIAGALGLGLRRTLV
jgi:putative membrane protein